MEEQLRILTANLEGLHNDMATCGFNSYGIKRNTYFDWLARSEKILKEAQAIRDGLTAQKAPAPPPPPVPAKV